MCQRLTNLATAGVHPYEVSHSALARRSTADRPDGAIIATTAPKRWKGPKRWEGEPVRVLDLDPSGQALERPAAGEFEQIIDRIDFMRRAKIVCTLGPAVDSYDQLKALVEAGMNVARFNFSHGTHAEHEERYHRVRKVSEETGRAVGVLADLQGPKIRLETFADGPVELVAGDEFTITTEDVPGDRSICGTTYKGLPGDVRKGDPVLINDGNVALQVIEVHGPQVRCLVIEGGVISDHKGINLPGAAVNVPALSNKDVEDLEFALRMGVDMVALSFVRDADDVRDVRRVMDEVGRRVPVIAKVEKPQAVENMEAVVAAFDAVMVARGDLAVEYPLERVPVVQKRLIEMCRRNAKPVIVATQMMESMINNSRPTRAEASDVANAVLDGADAVMLSAESSVGKYPIETVKTMSRIVEAAETELLGRGLQPLAPGKKPRTQGGAVARAAAELADFLDAKALVAFTKSGDTARRLARYRVPEPVLAFTTDPSTRNQLALTWGVQPHLVQHVDHTDAMVDLVDQEMLKISAYGKGDTVIITAGSPPGVPGTTNMVRVHHLGGGQSESASRD
jgi:pyruvate kinase